MLLFNSKPFTRNKKSNSIVKTLLCFAWLLIWVMVRDCMVDGDGWKVRNCWKVRDCWKVSNCRIE